MHDDRAAFNAARMLYVLHKYSITTLCAPPTVYRQLVTTQNRVQMEQTPPATLEHCVGAGEPLNGEVIRLWEQMTVGILICDGYGQSETIMLCGNFPQFPVRPGSMGKPSPGVTLRILDERGAESQHGEEGEIGVLCEKSEKGGFFGLFDGYMNMEGELKLPVRVGPDGRPWYLTGDRAKADVDGFFWFVGRSDDVINSAGYRIGALFLRSVTCSFHTEMKGLGPFEVESALKLHPGVVESAVVASPDPHRVEVVKAFIVLTPEYARRKDVDMLKQEIQDFCKKNAAPYKYPRRVEFVDGDFLPKTISGKIKRGDLKKLEWKAYSGRL